MDHLTRFKLKKNGNPFDSVAACVERALNSHNQAEQQLRNLQLSRLPAMGKSLERAVADMESLHFALSALPPGRPVPGVLRSRIESLRSTSNRVSALFHSAQDFHAGLAIMRATEACGYDALGKLGGLSAARSSLHRLETRG